MYGALSVSIDTRLAISKKIGLTALILLFAPSPAFASFGVDIGLGIGIGFGILIACGVVFGLYKRGGGWEFLGFMIALFIILPMMGFALLYIATFVWFYL